jgi:xanthine dehydrogenase YagT iron-sulfur-binding subunit
MQKKNKSPKSSGISRRNFLKNMGVSTVGIGVAKSKVLQKIGKASDSDASIIGPQALPVILEINGKDYKVEIEPRMTLADVIRDQINLTGTKIGCDRGACGACTVILDGKTVTSCLTLAVDAIGKPVQTIEGLSESENKLHPVQQSFIEHDALQCGFCTSGMIMSCKNLLDHNSNPSADDIKIATSGNLCRCGTYPKVFEAVKQVSAGK